VLMAARARRQFLADLGRYGEPAFPRIPACSQAAFALLASTSPIPRLEAAPWRTRRWNLTEKITRRESDRGTQGEVARPACPDLHPDGAREPRLLADQLFLLMKAPRSLPDARGTRPGKEACPRREDVDRCALASVLMQKDRQMNTVHATPEVIGRPCEHRDAASGEGKRAGVRVMQLGAWQTVRTAPP